MRGLDFLLRRGKARGPRVGDWGKGFFLVFSLFSMCSHHVPMKLPKGSPICSPRCSE